MKASDICVGDWLNIYNFPNDNPKQDDLYPAKVNAVFIFEPFKEPDVADVELVFKNKEGGSAIASRPLDTCLPIKLTEDILVKNGFEKNHDDEAPAEECYFYRLFAKPCGWFDIDAFGLEEELGAEFTYHDININYVHQLQHLLRLCGIEKELIID